MTFKTVVTCEQWRCIACFLLVGLVFCPPVGADQTPIANQMVSAVQDKVLDQCIAALMKKFNWQTTTAVESIKCHKSGIQSVQGIEQFGNLKHLSLFGNSIKTIDINALQKLETLNIAGNQLQRLTLSQLPRLEKVYIFKNRLTNLQVENLPRLTQIKANNNALDTVQLSATPQLVKLYLFDNQLELLDIEALSSLTYLDVRQNPMPDSFYDFLDKQDHLTARHDGNMDDWD